MTNPNSKRRSQARKRANHPHSKKPPAGARLPERKENRPDVGPETLEPVAIASQMSSYSQFHSGPLPDPQTLDHYNQIVPGAAKDIVDSFVNQTNHRRSQEKRGQIFGFVLIVLGLCAGGFCLYREAYTQGAWLIAAVLGGSGLVAIINGDGLKRHRDSS